MPKLLIATRTSHPHGGADRIVCDLARELPSRSWDVVLGLAQGRSFNQPRKYLDVNGDLPHVVLDGQLGTRAARCAALSDAIRRIQPDVVLSMRVFDAYEPTISAKRASSQRRPRLAVGVRGYEAPYLDDMVRYRDAVDLIVTSGELIAAACRDLCGIDPLRVTSIGGGVHLPLVPPSPRRRGDRPLRLLYAGRLAQVQKRILDLPPIVQSLVERGIPFELDVAGIGPEEAIVREQLAPFIERGVVRFHGWMEREDLYSRLLPTTDVFLHLAAWEGVTIAPREGMIHGAVPVISDFTGLRAEGQFVDRVNSLVFPVGDVTAAVDCIQRLAEDDPLLEQLSAAAMRSQTGKYSFPGSIDAWAAALDRCLEQPAMLGASPRIPERFAGRLSDYGVPSAVQATLRGWLNWPVHCDDAGSEWPTASGLMSPESAARFDQYARNAESHSTSPAASQPGAST